MPRGNQEIRGGRNIPGDKDDKAGGRVAIEVGGPTARRAVPVEGATNARSAPVPVEEGRAEEDASVVELAGPSSATAPSATGSDARIEPMSCASPLAAQMARAASSSETNDMAKKNRSPSEPQKSELREAQEHLSQNGYGPPPVLLCRAGWGDRSNFSLPKCQ